MKARRARRLGLGLAALVMCSGVVLLGSSATRARPSDHKGTAAFRALDREGLAAALDTLERLAALDSLVLRNAHQIAHALGRQALALEGNDPRVLNQCRPIFASGCYHGVVEGYLHARGRIDMAELERMCRAGAAREPGTAYECVHGLGHGVLGAVALDAPAALGYCDSLSTPGFRSACHEGAFMEAMTAAVGAHAHGMHEPQQPSSTPGRLALDPSDPYAPCDRFGDPYADSCWLFQGFALLRTGGFDAAAGFHACDAAPGNRAGRCYESIGLQLTGLFQRDDEWIVRQCAKGRRELAPHCAAGVALALAHIDWSGARATGFCASAPEGWRAACYDAAAGLLAELARPTEVASICAAVEPSYTAGCLRAAGLGSAD